MKKFAFWAIGVIIQDNQRKSARYRGLIMRKVILAILLGALTVSLLYGCGATGAGKLITEEKDFTGFTHVDVEGAFDVDITKSDSFSVIISADEGFFTMSPWLKKVKH